MFVHGIMAQRANAIPYVADAVEWFGPGGTDFLTKTSGVTGMNDNKTFTFSSWFFLSSAFTGPGCFMSNFVAPSNLGPFYLTVNTSNKIICKAGVSGGGEGVHAIPENTVLSSTTITEGTWHHLLISFDAATTTFHLYLDDVDDSASPTTYNHAIEWDAVEYTAACYKTAFGGGYQYKWYGDLSDFWFDTTYLDISTTSNRRKFIDASKKPVNLNSDGSGPTGNSPDIFFAGDVTPWQAGTNHGTMGGFDQNGSVSNSTNEPVEV